MSPSQRAIVRVVGAALVAGLSGWVVWAQIGTSGTVLGCVGNSGIIRGLDETTGSCRAGDTELSWYTKAGADAAWAAAGHTHTFDIPRADGPCFDNTNRYVDCRNGTVTDTVTGLIWLQQLNCLPVDTWAGANQAAAGLENGDCGLTDNSSAGDWRLPTEDEWSATIARAVALGCVAGGSPVLTNDAGTSCYGTGAGSSFVGVVPGGPLSSVWWSRSTNEANPAAAWFAHLSNGGLLDYDKDGASLRVWPVRGGSR